MILPVTDREWYDLALVGLIVVFMLLKALLINRESRLGLAMSVTNLALATAYLWSLIVLRGRSLLVTVTDTLIHVAVAGAVLWCVYELVSARVRDRRAR